MPTCPAFHRQVQLGCWRGVAEVHLNSLSCAVGVGVVVVVVGGGGGVVIVVVFVVVAAAAVVVQNKCGK